METLKHLLFPLTWCNPYIPRLPDSLVGVLDAPQGFMIGMHLESVSTDFDGLNTLRYEMNLEEEVYIVSLDTNEVSNAEKPANVPYKSLPAGPLKDLEKRLEAICKGAGITLGQDLSYLDEAFDFAERPGGDVSRVSRWTEDEILNYVRDAFLRFMVDVLGNFRCHLVPPGERLPQ